MAEIDSQMFRGKQSKPDKTFESKNGIRRYVGRFSLVFVDNQFDANRIFAPIGLSNSRPFNSRPFSASEEFNKLLGVIFRF